MAIRLGWLPDSSLVARRIGPVTGRLVATPDYVKTHGAPASLEDIANHPALMQGTEIWRVRDGDQVITLHPQGRFKADNGQALLSAVLAGLGIAMLPDFLIDEHIASGALVTLLPQYPMPEAGLYVVRPPAITRHARCACSPTCWWSGWPRNATRRPGNWSPGRQPSAS